MLEKKVSDITEEEIERLDHLRSRDNVTNEIVTNLLTEDVINFDLIDLLEKRSFKKREYYIASEVLFDPDISTKWIELVVKVIYTKEEEDIESFIREIVNAYNSGIEPDLVEQCINLCKVPVDLKVFIEDKVHSDEMDTKVRETIENIPALIEKIEVDNTDGKKKYIEIQNELNEKSEEIINLKEQLKKLTEQENIISDKKYEEKVKEAAYYESKYKSLLNEVYTYKNECVELRNKVEKYEQKLSSNTQNTANNNESLKALQQLFNEGIENIVKTVASNYGNIVDGIKTVDEKINNFNQDKDVAEKIEKIIAQNENIIDSIHNISVTASTHKDEYVDDKTDYFIEGINEEEMMQGYEESIGESTDNDEEKSESITDDYTNIEKSVNLDKDDIPVNSEKSYDESYTDSIDENSEESTDFSASYLEKNENDTVMCKADDLLKNKILTSKTKDDKEDKKIKFFSGIKFRISSEQKQKELIVGLMLRKKYSMENIKCVKAILETGKVKNRFVFDLINREDTKEEDLMRLLAFTNNNESEE